MTHYQTGGHWEQAVKTLFEDQGGYEVWQARGSRGPADLIALKGTPGLVTEAVLIQVKRITRQNPTTGVLIGHNEWNALYALATELHATPVLAAWTGLRNQKAELTMQQLDGFHVAHAGYWPAVPYTIDQITSPLITTIAPERSYL